MQSAIHLAQTERATIVMVDIIPEFARPGQFDGTACLCPDDKFIAAEGEALALSRALREAANFYEDQYRTHERLKNIKSRKPKSLGGIWADYFTTSRDRIS